MTTWRPWLRRLAIATALRLLPDGPIAGIVLSDGDIAATEHTVWSMLGLGHRIRVIERSAPDDVQAALARAERLGVEVFAADWTTHAGAEAALVGLDVHDVVVVGSSGETFEITDWGAARAEIESLAGSPGGVLVDGIPQLRMHAPDAELMEVLGTSCASSLEHVRVVAGPSEDPSAHAAASTAEPGIAELIALVLFDDAAGVTASACEATIDDAAEIADAVVVLDRSAVGGVDVGGVDVGGLDVEGVEGLDVNVPVFAVDWSDPSQLSELLDSLDARHFMVLAAGERVLVDQVGWAGDQCLLDESPVALLVGDDTQIRIAPCNAEMIGEIGSAPTPTTLVGNGIRLVPAGLPHGDVIIMRFPSLASPGEVRRAIEGDERSGEQLAEALVLDEDLRLLEQARSERPIDWSRPRHGAKVGVVVVVDDPGHESWSRCADTLRSLEDQTHQVAEVVLVVPAGTDVPASFVDLVRVIEHHGLFDHDPPDARLARMANTGSLIVEGDWVALVDPGDVFHRNHIEHSLGVAYDDRSEYVHGLVVTHSVGESQVEMAADRQGRTGQLGPLLFAGELRALQLRPNAQLAGEHASANRAARLACLGAIESAAEMVTAVRPRVAGSCVSSPPVSKTTIGRRLHLGCGPNHLEGWVNIDVDEARDPDLVHDLSKGLPFEDGSADLVYSEHFFEHLTLREGLALLRECKRVLRSGGVLRIAMPDLESTVHAYLHGWRDQVWVNDFPQLDSAAHMLNMGLREWGHQYVYDFADLTMRLRTLGFDSVRRGGWGQSNIQEFVGLETREDSLLIVEATSS